jgi:HK97 gp10 family phage protein
MSRSFYGRTGLEFKDDLTGKLLKLKGEIRARAREAVLAAGDMIAQRAYDKANVSPRVIGHAVDGRHMRDCIEVIIIEDPHQVSAKIGIDISNVPYAPHQEFGSRGKPFLRPAIDESREEAHQIMRSVLIDGAEPRSLVRFRRFA